MLISNANGNFVFTSSTMGFFNSYPPITRRFINSMCKSILLDKVSDSFKLIEYLSNTSLQNSSNTSTVKSVIFGTSSVDFILNVCKRLYRIGISACSK